MEKVGLFSVGSIENKIPFSLSPLLLSSDLILSSYKNYAYPENLSPELVYKIEALLSKNEIHNVVFDLRVHNWSNPQHLRHSRTLSQSLQAACHDLGINTSIILSNGGQLLGNAVGVMSEMKEATKVLTGEGPLDLTKFTVEIGADFLLMMKKAHQKIDAKKWLRDKIMHGDFSPFCPDFTEKTKLLSPKKGYIHHLVMEEINLIRSELAAVHPAIGLSLLKKPGDWVEKGEEIVEMNLPQGQRNPINQEICHKVFVFSAEPPIFQPLILERLGLNLHS